MKTKLKRFKVINFRSIEESDWIEIGDNSCLVGTNEAGKTNLLIALWKLKPANQEEIRPLADFPRHLYSKYKAEDHQKDVFIKADIELNEELQQKIAAALLCDAEQVKIALVERRYDGLYYISLPYSRIDSYPKTRIEALIDKFMGELTLNEVYIKEAADLKEKIIKTLSELISEKTLDSLSEQDLKEIIANVNKLITYEFGKKQNLPAFFHQGLLHPLTKILDSFAGKAIKTTEEIRKLIVANIPKFIYYSDYGNLDSEIYLPRVIEDMERMDLTESARAKARTLDVLFKYVNLSPQEIFELGNDKKVIIQKFDHYNSLISTEEEELSSEEVKEWAEKKKERGVLLKSASGELTKSFKQWWQQGNYIFAFEADGSHFRINVSDELRPESIELEGRSRGLQWFFSFFLVFLVETKEKHNNSVLLLDEPGLSLHPLAQYDLAKFFRKLATDNQLVYTTHSPFMVDMDNLANVRAVYVDEKTGRTRVSSNLRYNETDAEKSIYPVHAALGLTVSDTLLLGCLPVLVEGPSDQIYLSMIKRYLTGKGLLQYNREIVFIGTGGVRGMAPVTKLVSSRDNKLPHVLMDSDKPGREYLAQLQKGSYAEQKDRLLEMATFLGAKPYEIEDLLPPKALIMVIDRKYRSRNYFEDSYKEDEPIVDQISNWAKANEVKEITEEKGWKVELAREVINQFDRVMRNITPQLEQKWVSLFQAFTSE